MFEIGVEEVGYLKLRLDFEAEFNLEVENIKFGVEGRSSEVSK